MNIGTEITRFTSLHRKYGTATTHSNHLLRAKSSGTVFDHCCEKFNFDPWIVTLLVNHYHILGYMKCGENLGPFMQHLHGSVAKLVNDLLPVRHRPFWRHTGNQDYFDGCIRDVLQAHRAFEYTKLQAVRAGIVKDYRDYPHTRIYVERDCAIATAARCNAYPADLPYARYERRKRRKRA